MCEIPVRELLHDASRTIARIPQGAQTVAITSALELHHRALLTLVEDVERQEARIKELENWRTS